MPYVPQQTDPPWLTTRIIWNGYNWKKPLRVRKLKGNKKQKLCLTTSKRLSIATRENSPHQRNLNESLRSWKSVEIYLWCMNGNSFFFSAIPLILHGFLYEFRVRASVVRPLCSLVFFQWFGCWFVCFLFGLSFCLLRLGFRRECIKSRHSFRQESVEKKKDSSFLSSFFLQFFERNIFAVS